MLRREFLKMFGATLATLRFGAPEEPVRPKPVALAPEPPLPRTVFDLEDRWSAHMSHTGRPIWIEEPCGPADFFVNGPTEVRVRVATAKRIDVVPWQKRELEMPFEDGGKVVFRGVLESYEPGIYRFIGTGDDCLRVF